MEGDELRFTLLTQCGCLSLTGVLTSLRRLFAKIGVNECNGDVSTVAEVCPVPATSMHRLCHIS